MQKDTGTWFTGSQNEDTCEKTSLFDVFRLEEEKLYLPIKVLFALLAARLLYIVYRAISNSAWFRSTKNVETKIKDLTTASTMQTSYDQNTSNKDMSPTFNDNNAEVYDILVDYMNKISIRPDRQM